MARHRNVRSMNYDEEYDGYDDVYGHSVEDDYSASPSVQQFIYDRNRSYSRSTYMDSDIPEEEEPYSLGKDEDQVDFKPQNEMEEVQMLSCLDFLKDRLGDKYNIQAAKKAVLNHKFDAEKALDALLQKNTAQPSLPTLPKAKAQIPPQTTGFALKDSRPNNTPFAQKPSLSQLAALKINPSPAVPVNSSKLGLTLASNVLQPKDANVHSALQPSFSILSKPSGPSALVRPSLAELSKLRLSGSEAKVPSPSLSTSKPNSSYLAPSLNLASALKTKCTIVESSTQIESVVIKREKFSLLPRENQPIDNALLKSSSCTSPFGRILSAENRKTHKIMKKGTKKSLFPKINAGTIKAFKFTDPSPDDLILSRLRR